MERAIAQGCAGFASLATVIERFLAEVLPGRRGQSQDFAAIVTLALETAMRRSEILGLLW
jgi:integrase